MRTTEWKRYIAIGGRVCRIRAIYGFSKTNGPPRWSVTGEIQSHASTGGRWREDSFGCLHEKIAKRFPDIGNTIKWHLCSPDTGPMHYVSNAVYWYQQHAGCGLYDVPAGTDPFECFESTVVLGALRDDLPFPWELGAFMLIKHEGERREAIRVAVTAWCEARLPRLLEAMRADIAALEAKRLVMCFDQETSE